MNKNIVILYHKGCADGFSAAWAAWKKFKDTATYIPVAHDEPALPLKNKIIYMLDFTYPPKLLQALIKNNVQVTSIDHHETREYETKMTQQGVYNVQHSGAVLAWNYFHPKKSVPILLKHIEDIDLWRLKLPNTRPLLSYISLLPFTFDIWDRLAKNVQNSSSRRKLIAQGNMILTYENIIINRILSDSAELVEFAGYKTYAVNSIVYKSELGNALYKKLPPMGIVWKQKDGKIKISLRSDGSVDVGKIAARYGGGGHLQAAAFFIKANQKFPWRFLKEHK